MIQIQAKLVREPVYIAGDMIECIITFKNISQPCESTSPEVLAWASAQLHCYCSIDEGKVPMPANVRCDQLVSGNKETSFVPNQGEKGFVIYSSQPSILLCDLHLLPGDVKAFVYTERLPQFLPPSFNGQMVRYNHKISIGTQKMNAPSKLMKIPLKVIQINDFVYPERDNQDENLNPFLAPKPSLVDCAMEYLEDLTAPRQPSYFNITQGEHYVARFCLLKSNFRLGEDIVGTFDFSKATVPCVQYSVTLQSMEKTSNGKCTSMLSYGKAHEVCLYLKQTHMALPIPVHAAASFQTDIVELSWRLHFEFVMTPNDLKALPPELQEHTSTDWMPPKELDVNTMVWNLPVNIFPPHSAHAAVGLNLQREFFKVL
ncbi:RAB6A-GEF complex partner protein 2 [Galendromus occidentalis]|uniref:RAB6A-GEF complex partner protein 2 n=1 Tax=Galendromus occidentalis TaxID=34638 RepID=A0AAJ6QRC6_9ACAR|nr:RAB6A-GEF complex partner protein 2 [Galendromus occidentalis]